MYQVIYFEREKSKRICTEIYNTMPKDDEVYDLMEDLESRYAEVYYDKYGTQTFDVFETTYTN